MLRVYHVTGNIFFCSSEVMYYMLTQKNYYCLKASQCFQRGCTQYLNNWTKYTDCLTWFFSFFLNSKRLKLRSPKACQYITPKGVRHLTITFFNWEWRAKITVTDYNLFLNIGEPSDNQTGKLETMCISAAGWNSSKGALLSRWW